MGNLMGKQQINLLFPVINKHTFVVRNRDTVPRIPCPQNSHIIVFIYEVSYSDIIIVGRILRTVAKRSSAKPIRLFTRF